MTVESVRASASAAANVVGGWLGVKLPPIPKQRNKTRAGYRKTDRRRPRPERQR